VLEATQKVAEATHLIVLG